MQVRQARRGVLLNKRSMEQVECKFLTVRPAQTGKTNARFTRTFSPYHRRCRANLPIFLVSLW